MVYSCVLFLWLRRLLTYRVQEAESREIKLDEDDQEAVAILLLYLYTLDIPTFEVPQNGCVKAWRAYVIGHKYGLTALEAAAEAWYVRLVQRWTVSTEGQLLRSLFHVRRVYEHYQPGIQKLRIAITALLSTNAGNLLTLEAGRTVLQEYPDFTFDLLEAMSEKIKQ